MLIKDFTNLYSLNKTLRFELVPQGKTNDYIDKWIKELELENKHEVLKDKVDETIAKYIEHIKDKLNESNYEPETKSKIIQCIENSKSKINYTDLKENSVREVVSIWFKEINNELNEVDLRKNIKNKINNRIKKLSEIVEDELKNIILEDKNRAKKYEKVKKILDEYHKDFIERVLKNLDQTDFNKLLKEYLDLYTKKKDKKETKEFVKIKKNLRKKISDTLTKNPDYKILDKDKLFKRGKKSEKKDSSHEENDDTNVGGILEKFLEENSTLKHKLEESLRNNEDETIDLFELLRSFEGFTTYFRNFHKNRENLYSDEDKFSTIAHRLIHENLPKFIDNIKIYQKAKEKGLPIEEIQKQLGITESLDDVFSIEYFTKCLTQSGIDRYNYILGGKSVENGQNIRGVNSFINNEINQSVSEKKDRVPVMKMLYKLPLFDRTSSSFRYDPIENDQDLIERIVSFYERNLTQYIDTTTSDDTPVNILEMIKELLQNIHNYREGLYVNGGTTLTQISQKIFGDWRYIHDVLSYYYDTIISPLKKDKKGNLKSRLGTEEKQKEKWMKQKQFSVVLIEKALNEYKKVETNEELKNKITDTTLCDFFARCGTDKDGKDLFKRIDEKLTEKNSHSESLKNLMNFNFGNERKLMQNESRISLIKNFLDAILGDKEDITAGLLHFIKPLIPREEVADKNELFYSEFERYYNLLSEIIPLYNKVRNYLTQKPFSIEKIKLNFENPMLLAGWDVNKEADNSCVLFRKNGFYYLGIMNKYYRDVFKNYETANDGEDFYEKMVYKLLPGPNKMLPKVFFSEKNIGYFNPSDEILRIRNTASYSKNGKPREGYKKADFSVNDCQQLIDFFKESILKHEDWSKFNFQFKPTSRYNDISEFYKDVKNQGYKINFVKIPSTYINQLVQEGKLYLFKIHNKDFSEKKKPGGKDNLHTLYWKMLFSEENLKDVVFKLDGEAEIFFRPKSIIYDENIWKNGHHNEKLKDKFNYPIIKDRRFALDKIYFHVPITINFKAGDVPDNEDEEKNNQQNEMKNESFNQKILSFLKDRDDVHIIGIDRGERHLLYVVVINSDGKIVEQFSLNKIPREKSDVPIDYLDRLNNKEGQLDEARKNWQTIQNIKELKEGYLSHVIHIITRLIVKYNAIVVMEDLNSGFKRGRQKVEKQVYQKFEKMLINKLNYLVFKDKKAGEPGGVLKGLQLTDKFESFKNLGKQSGIIFYVPPAYTSAIDPVTGYVQYLYPLKRADSIEKAKNFYSKFDSTKYNAEKDRFEFTFDYEKIPNTRYEGKSQWTICTSDEERYYWDKSLNNGKGGQKEYKTTSEMKQLFKEAAIPYHTGEELKQYIAGISGNPEKKIKDKEFFNRLNLLLHVTLKLRHNNGKDGDKEQDYILSPVEPFFDSRKAKGDLPENADANGAFNIARKGLVLLKRLKKMDIDEFEKTKKSKDGKSQWLPHKEWLEFSQEKHAAVLN